MEYLTVGTDKITREKFVPITDDSTTYYKPAGGLWLTRHMPEYPGYNEWVDYLIDNPRLLYFKSKSKNIFSQPCSVVTLVRDANIYTLDSDDSFKYLMTHFNRDDKMFSYEKLSREYDGIYVKILGLLGSDPIKMEIVKKYCVNTLSLFNLDCIDYYYSGRVNIRPFDIEYADFDEEAREYHIDVSNVKKRIR